MSTNNRSASSFVGLARLRHRQDDQDWLAVQPDSQQAAQELMDKELLVQDLYGNPDKKHDEITLPAMKMPKVVTPVGLPKNPVGLPKRQSQPVFPEVTQRYDMPDGTQNGKPEAKPETRQDALNHLYPQLDNRADSEPRQQSQVPKPAVSAKNLLQEAIAGIGAPLRLNLSKRNGKSEAHPEAPHAAETETALSQTAAQEAAMDVQPASGKTPVWQGHQLAQGQPGIVQSMLPQPVLLESQSLASHQKSPAPAANSPVSGPLPPLLNDSSDLLSAEDMAHLDKKVYQLFDYLTEQLRQPDVDREDLRFRLTMLQDMLALRKTMTNH